MIDKKRLEEAVAILKPNTFRIQFLSDFADKEYCAQALDILLQSAQSLLSGECFANEPIDIEVICDKVHKAYCKYHLEHKGTEYWTKGDYSKLNEEGKEYDRRTVRAVIEALSSIPRQLATEEEIEKIATGVIEKHLDEYVTTINTAWECGEEIAKALVGKIPRQMMTREEIEKIIMDKAVEYNSKRIIPEFIWKCSIDKLASAILGAIYGK